MVTVEKSTVEVGKPIVVAVLPWALTPELLPLTHSHAFQHVTWPSARPPTSLLRLHCALIV